MKATVKSSIIAKVYMVLKEDEARALLAITIYGADAFLKSFYQQLGTAYLKEHEAGLKSLFKNIEPIERELNKIDKARAEFEKT